MRAINDNRRQYVVSSFHICVEIISRSYVIGGERITKGLPHSFAYDRMPENGYELKTKAFGFSGIMVRMTLVIGKTDCLRRYFTE